MGLVLSTLEENISQKPSSKILELSLAKVSEFYRVFKANNENFWLDFREFNIIFGENERVFRLWDNAQNGLADALELFSGLALFARGSFEEKARLLFDFHDFNGLNSLSLSDLQFLIGCCVDSTLRIVSCASKDYEEEVESMVQKSFIEDTRINISQFLDFTESLVEVHKFFRIISREPPAKKISDVEKDIAKLENPTFEQAEKPAKEEEESLAANFAQSTGSFEEGNLLSSWGFRAKKDFMTQAARTADLHSDQRFTTKNASLKLNWIFGFKPEGFSNSFIFYKDREAEHGAEGRLIYFTANVAVVFYYKRGKQRHYVRHSRKICSMALSESGLFCATGEMGSSPEIHVWNTMTFKTELVIQSIKNLDVYLLQFINNDNYLVSVCKRENPPITIHDLRNKSIVLTTFLPTFVRNVIHIENLTKTFNGDFQSPQQKCKYNIQNVFISFSKTQIHFYEVSEKTKNFKNLIFTIVEKVNGKNNEIKSCAAIFQKLEKYDVVFNPKFEEFGLTLFIGLNDGLLVRLDISNVDESFSKTNFINLKKSIEHIKYYKEQQLFALTSNSIIHVIDLKTAEIESRIELTLLPLRLTSFVVKCVERGHKDVFWFVTANGEIFRIYLELKNVWERGVFNKRVKVKTTPKMTNFQHSYNTLTVVETDDGERIVYAGGKDAMVIGVSSKLRLVVDQFSLAKPVTSIDSYYSLKKEVIVAVGTMGGKIVVRKNFEEEPNGFQVKGDVTALKFSQFGKYLIAGSKSGAVYAFKQSNDSYFEEPPKKFSLLTEYLLTINVTKDSRHFIAETNTLNYYKFELPDITYKEIIKENFGIEIPKLRLKYFIQNSTALAPIVMGRDVGVIITGEREGMITMFSSLSALNESSCSFYRGHSAAVCDISLTNDRRYLYSVGENEGVFFEWKLSLDIGVEKSKTPRGDFCNAPATINRQFSTNMVTHKTAEYIEDSFAYFRGFSTRILRQLIGEKYPVFVESDHSKKLCPDIIVRLRHVYGGEFTDFRNSVSYLHNFDFQPNQGEDPSKIDSTKLQGNETNEQYGGNLRRSINSSGMARSDAIGMKSFNANSMVKNMFIKNSASIRNHLRDNNKQIENLTASAMPSIPITDINSSILVNEVVKQSMRGTVSDENKKLANYLFLTLMKGLDENDMQNQQESYRNKNFDNMVTKCPRGTNYCKRHIIYFVSRIVVIINPMSAKDQWIYEGHRERISALSVHPFYDVVATGEAVNRPKIRVWHPASGVTLSVIDTFHKMGIFLLKMSTRSHFVFSVSVEEFVSLQVSDWKHQKAVSFRNTSVKRITDLAVNPTNPFSFATASFGQVDIWSFESLSIVHVSCIKIIESNFKQYVTALCFVAYFSEDQQQQKLILATSDGQIGVVNDGVFRKCAQFAPKKIITILKLAVFQSKVIILVVTEDGFLAAFNSYFERILFVDTKPADLSGSKLRSAVQSLDAYVCQNKMNIIVNTCSGQLLEFELPTKLGAAYKTYKFDDPIKTVLAQYHCSPNFDYGKNQNDYHSRKRVHLCIHPKHTILISMGDDRVIYFWNYLSKSIINTKQIDEVTHCLKLSPTGSHLAVGCEKGRLFLYELRISRPPNPATPNIYNISMDADPILVLGKDVTTAVLNVEFSAKAEFMAVSYDNASVKIEEEDGRSEKEGSVVVVYWLKDFMSRKTGTREGVEVSYKRSSEIRLNSLGAYDLTRTQTALFAAHFMAFSDDENYLIIHYQAVDDLQIRTNSSREGKYIVWSLTASHVETNLDILKSVRFRGAKLPNHIFGTTGQNYVAKSIDFFDNKDKSMLTPDVPNDRLVPSAVAEIQGVCFLGLCNGELAVAKSHMLYLGSDTDPEILPKSSLCQAKRFAGHISFVNQIEVSPGGAKLFTSGFRDECIFEWDIDRFEPRNDFNEKIEGGKREDLLLLECESPENFATFVQESKKRRQIVEIFANKGLSTSARYKLKLNKIIGRKALKRRANLVASVNKQLVYSAGTFVVVLSPVKLETDSLNLPEQALTPKDISKKTLVEQIASKNIMVDQNTHTKIGRHITLRNSEGKFQNNSKISESGIFNILSKEVISESNSPNSKIEHRSKSMYKNMSNFKRKNPQKSETNSDSDEYDEILSREKEDAILEREENDETLPKEKNDITLPNENTEVLGKKFIYNCGNQTFFVPQKEKQLSCPAEVSSLEIAPDGKTICIGTNDVFSTLYFWEITSLSYFGEIKLTNCVSTLFIRFSFDSNFLLCCGYTPDLTASIYFCNVERCEILALSVLTNSISCKIRDAAFLPINNYEFFTVGRHHAAHWIYKADILIFQEQNFDEINETMPALGRESTLDRSNKQNDYEFLAIRFFQTGLFVTCCTKGMVYLWTNLTCVQKKECFDRFPATTICPLPNNSLNFLVGGFGSHLVYYHLVGEELDFSLVEKQRICISPQLTIEKIMPIDYQIQSLVFAKENHLLVGTRSGNITEIILSLNSNIPLVQKNSIETSNLKPNSNTKSINNSNCRELANLFDHEMPKVAELSFNGKEVYCATERGLLLVYSLSSMEKIYKLQVKKGTVIDLVVAENRLLIVFDDELILFDTTREFSVESCRSVDPGRRVVRVKSDRASSTVAVLCYQNGSGSYFVELFKLERFLEHKMSEPVEEVTAMDFSSDGHYFLCQTLDGERLVFNTGTWEREQLSEDYTVSIDWLGESHQFSSEKKMWKFHSLFSVENPIRHILSVDSEARIVIDSLATVSLTDSHL